MRARPPSSVSIVGIVVLVVGALAALAAPAAAGPPSSDSTSFDVVDSALCSFPIESSGTVDSKAHLVLNQHSPSKIVLTGTSAITLTNQTTGYSTVLTSRDPFDPSSIGFASGTATFVGSNLGLASFIPIASFHGRATLDLSTSLLTSLTGTKTTIDPCALLDPAAPPVTPRTTPAPWPAPPDALGGSSSPA